MSSQAPQSKKIPTYAPTPLASKMRPGAVFRVDDRAIHFPTSDNSGAREGHEKRWAVVVQARAYCPTKVPQTVLVVPCSASVPGTTLDVKIEPGEPGFTKPGYAFTTLVQPVLKGALTQYLADVTPGVLAEIQDKLASLMPPREVKTIAAAIPAEDDDEDEFPDEEKMKLKK